MRKAPRIQYDNKKLVAQVQTLKSFAAELIEQCNEAEASLLAGRANFEAHHVAGCIQAADLTSLQADALSLMAFGIRRKDSNDA